MTAPKDVVAMALARALHNGQVDKAGEDYFEGHLARVASQFSDIHRRTLAYLHDIVEDTPITIYDLRAMFGRDVADGVWFLTRQEGELYREYIARVARAEDPAIIDVKLADLNDHLRDTLHISASMVDRYSRAIDVLTEARRRMEP